MKLGYRKPIRRTWRATLRNTNRSCVCVRWRAPDDLGDALTAFGRALRAHRRMARLAPRFFDSAVIDREAQNRAEQRRWMAAWEPILARVYGVEHAPAAPADDLPPLPPLQTQQAVERHLAAWQLWMELGRAAMDRHRRRHPHARLSLTRLARLLELAFDFKKLAVGLDSPNPLPEKITYDDDWPDLKRAYGHWVKPPPVEPTPENADSQKSGSSGRESAPSESSHNPSQPTSAATVQHVKPHDAPSAKSPPAWPPPDTKRDVTPVKLVIGPHGLLTYEYPKPDSGP
jgi:hypothetical protein